MTIPNKDSSQQEIFDFVLNNLRKQGKQALDAKGNCVYRADDGCKCAAGILILDSDYQPTFENICIRALIRGETSSWDNKSSPQLLSWQNLDNEKTFLIENLQTLHDNIDNWHNDGFVGEVAAKRIAKHQNLTYTAPE